MKARIVVLVLLTSSALAPSAALAQFLGVCPGPQTCARGVPDADCDGVLDVDDFCPGVEGLDRDGDGIPEGARGECDCNDADSSVHPGVPDTCDGVDNDCDQRLDVHTALDATGTQLVAMLARAEIENPGTRTVATPFCLELDSRGVPVGQRILDGNELLGVSAAPGGTPDFEVYLRVPLELMGAEARVVDVVFDRVPQTGDNDFFIGLSDGTRVVSFALGDVGGSGSRYLGIVSRFTDGGAVLEDQTDSVLGEPFDEDGPYSVRFSLGDQPDVRVRTAAGVETTFDASAPAERRLDPTLPWSLVLFASQRWETYQVRSLSVFQPFPHHGGEVDADGDGFPASCECDDGDADVSPAAREVCNGRDDECGGDGDRITFLSGGGAEILSRVRRGLARNPGARSLNLGGGAPPPVVASARSCVDGCDVFYREPLRSDVPILDALDPRVLEYEVTIDPLTGPVRVGLSFPTVTAGKRFLGVTINPFFDRLAVVDAADLSDGKIDATDLSPVSLPPGPYRIVFRFAASEAVATIVAGDGSTTTLPFPVGRVPLLTEGEGVELVLTSPSSSASAINFLSVTQEASDIDADGVCDALDRCLGADGPDDDGDGVPSGCDCDDRDAGVRPGATERCDGVDEDCDGRPDFERLAYLSGHDAVRQALASGTAENSSGVPLGVAGGAGEVTSFAPSSFRDGVPLAQYRQAIRVRPGVPVNFRVEWSSGLSMGAGWNAPLIALSDGVRVRGFQPQWFSGALVVGALNGSDVGAGLRDVPEFPLARTDDLGLPASVDDPMSVEASVTISGDAMVIDVAGQRITQPWDLVGEDLELLLVGRGNLRAAGTRLSSLEVWQSIDDADVDLVCDLRDVCAGFPDLVDGDADGIPDYCDPCLGRNGVDLDGDGVPSGCDCDDSNPDIRPGATDTCNGRDDDCNGSADRHTALTVRGSELLYRIGSGAATSNGRPLIARSGGDAVEVQALVDGPGRGDVYYRDALALLSPEGSVQRFQVLIDRDARPGDHDFRVAVSDGARVFGVGLFNDGEDGRRHLAAPFTGEDGGSHVAAVDGAGVSLDEARPYILDFVLGDGDPRVTVTTGDAESATLSMPSDTVGAIALTGLSLLLVGDDDGEVHVLRRLEVTQPLRDSDGDTVCDLIDFCDGEDDTGADTDGDRVVDICDVCPGGDDTLDTDADGVPNACDVCDAEDDLADSDGDRVPDACDPCPEDPANDSDGDMVCDMVDLCLPGDDDLDTDEDGVPDDCDECPVDPLDDADEDGSCDAVDVCQGDDRAGDLDGDGFCGDLDCDDTRASIFPGAEEVCDGFDSNCSGEIPTSEFDTDGDLVIDCVAEGSSGGGCSVGQGSPPSATAVLVLLVLLVFERRRRRG